jgi:hypothetical protein
MEADFMTGVKRVLSVCVLAIICGFFATNALAQRASVDPHIGLGVAFSDVSDLVTVLSDDAIASTLVPGVLVPIDVNSRFRLEPEIGGYRNSSTLTQSLGSAGTLPSTRTYTFFRAGTGAFWLTRRDRVTVYYGGRVAYLHYTQSLSGSGSYSYPSIPGKMFAPAVGAEFRLSDHFRLGGEVQLRFVSWETSSTNSSPTFSSVITGDSVSTHGALTLRFYF